MAQLPILYAMTKTGNVKTYKITVRHKSDHSIISRIHASKIGGKEQTDNIEIWEGMNIGKSNETSIKAQANFKAQSIYNKRLDQGYKTQEELGLIINEDNSFSFEKGKSITTNTDAQGKIKPMLALDDRLKIVFPCSVQTKFNGLRCIASKNKKGVMLTTRSGKQVFNERVEKKLGEIMKVGDMLDGELFSVGISLQTINSIVRTKNEVHPERNKLMFVVFDIPIQNTEWSERLKMLGRLPVGDFHMKSKEPVTIATTKNCPTQNVLDVYHKANTALGMEGTIVRLYDGMYEFGFRSNKLLKYKDRMDCEFRIIGGKEASGRDKGSVIFICQVKKGLEFSVRPKGSLDERKEMLKNFDKKYMGKKLTVEFESYTPTGVPFQPVGLQIRELL